VHQRAYERQCALAENRHGVVRSPKLTLFALALGTFAIGTGEFGSNGIIQLSAADLDYLKTYNVPPGSAAELAKTIQAKYPWLQVIALAQQNQVMVLAAPEDQFEQRLRDKNRCEQVRHQTEEQRDREPADRPGAELEEERHGDERRDMRVEQRPEHTAEPGVDRRAHAARGFELFLDALENEHVRVDADAHRQHESGDARQRHHRADIRHQAEQDDEVEEQCHDRVDS